jgi:hypothetical protein
LRIRKWLGDEAVLAVDGWVSFPKREELSIVETKKLAASFEATSSDIN